MSLRAYIDTETVNVNREDQNHCSIFQIAGIIEKDGKLIEKFNFNLYPGNDSNYDDSCMKFNNITKDDLKKYPDQSEVFIKFISILDKYRDNQNQKYHFVAYNADFDISMIRAWFNVNTPFKYWKYFYSGEQCVMRMAAFFLQDFRQFMDNFKLETVFKFMTDNTMISPFEGATNYHNALFDIASTVKIYKFFEKEFRQKLKGE